jgi:hypothetical protein
MDLIMSCLSKLVIKCKAHCACSNCCESDCMVQEGDIKRADSSTSIKPHSKQTDKTK